MMRVEEEEAEDKSSFSVNKRREKREFLIDSDRRGPAQCLSNREERLSHILLGCDAYIEE